MSKIRLLSILAVACFLAPGACLGQVTSWYKNYDGVISKYPITMHLYKTGHKYAGYYYYNSKEKLVYFTGDDSTLSGGKIRLSAFIGDKEVDESFTFSISGKAIAGKWDPGKNKPLIFSATETRPIEGFDYIYTEGSASLRPTIKGSPAASFEAASIWPTGNSAQAVFLKKIITEEWDAKNSTEDIGKIFLRQKKKFFADYIKDNKELKDEDVKEAYSFNMDVSDQMMIVYRSAKLIMLAHSNYAYTGGAHGNYGTTYIPLDVLNDKKLHLDDVVNPAGKIQLPGLLEKYFRLAYSLKKTDSLTESGLFANTIEPTDNFYITLKGIGFCYSPYEIGPYAMGEINIFIPFTELGAYLQPSFKRLLQ